MRIRGLAAAAVALAAMSGCSAAPATASRPSTAESAPASAPPSATPSSPAPSPSPVVVPSGVTAGIAVFDRRSGAFVSEVNPNTQFRSASLVKLFIALDYLWNRGPSYTIPTADLPRLEVMLRSSDDNAATYFWSNDGSAQIVTRMVTRLHLQNTLPPPPERTGWGFTAVTADDIVRVYQYILDEAPAPVREFVMSNLHASTKCGTDAFDQSFGIPTAFSGQPWAAKQGWSGFGDNPATPCSARLAGLASAKPAPASARAPRPSAVAAATTRDFHAVPAAAPYLDGVVLHTTGTVGADDRTIVAVLTQSPSGTPFARATATLTQLARALPVPPS